MKSKQPTRLEVAADDLRRAHDRHLDLSRSAAMGGQSNTGHAVAAGLTAIARAIVEAALEMREGEPPPPGGESE